MQVRLAIVYLGKSPLAISSCFLWFELLSFNIVNFFNLVWKELIFSSGKVIVFRSTDYSCDHSSTSASITEIGIWRNWIPTCLLSGNISMLSGDCMDVEG